MTGKIEIVALQPAWRGKAAVLLTEAFLDDPLYSAVLSGRSERRAFLLWMHEKIIDYAGRYGEVLTTSELDGVACLLPPGRTDMSPRRMARSGFFVMPFHLGIVNHLRFMSMLRAIDRARSESAPARYWYLWVLGVDPCSQGTGVGGALVRNLLEKADRDDVACFLETQKGDNVAYYERLGFGVVCEMGLPGTDVSSWSMVREPGSGRPAGSRT